MPDIKNMTEPEIRELMSKAAQAVSAVTGGSHFVLLVFDDPEIAQYVSNCEREDIIKAMYECADRLRQNQDVQATPQPVFVIGHDDIILTIKKQSVLIRDLPSSSKFTLPNDRQTYFKLVGDDCRAVNSLGQLKKFTGDEAVASFEKTPGLALRGKVNPKMVPSVTARVCLLGDMVHIVVREQFPSPSVLGPPVKAINLHTGYLVSIPDRVHQCVMTATARPVYE